MTQEWTITRLDTTEWPEWEYHDGTRVRAILQKRPGQSPWTVVSVNSRGKGSGCNSFKTRAEAHTFITNGRIFR